MSTGILMRNSAHQRHVTDGDDGSVVPLQTTALRLMTRAVNLLMVIFFCLAAILQINDPDPYIWIPLYMVPAVLTFLLVIRPDIGDDVLWKAVCGIHIVLCALCALYHIALILELKTQGFSRLFVHEEVRELAGCCIVLVWLAVCRFSSFATCCNSSGVTSGVLFVLTCILGILPLFFWSLCWIDGLSEMMPQCQQMIPSHV